MNLYMIAISTNTRIRLLTLDIYSFTAQNILFDESNISRLIIGQPPLYIETPSYES